MEKKISKKKISPKKKVALIVAAMNEKKGENPIVLDISKISTIADFMIICSAQNLRAVEAISDKVEEVMVDVNVRSREGLGSDWVLLDYNDVIVHIFETKKRSFVDLEGIWADAKSVEI